jgi:formate dehydrogenase subunit gamma
MAKSSKRTKKTGSFKSGAPVENVETVVVKTAEKEQLASVAQIVQPAATVREGTKMASRHKGPYTVSRYTSLARVNHWITAFSLILLALSGMSLFHPSLFWLSNLFGGGESVRALHPWFGIILAVSFLGLFVRFFRLNLWERNDNVWLSKLRSVMAGSDHDMPELGKYNAGQKLVFWLQSILIIILLISGFGLWEVYFGNSFNIEQKRLSALVHAVAAVSAILVWIVHVYAAIWVKGTVSAMTRGSVSGG